MAGKVEFLLNFGKLAAVKTVTVVIVTFYVKLLKFIVFFVCVELDPYVSSQ